MRQTDMDCNLVRSVAPATALVDLEISSGIPFLEYVKAQLRLPSKLVVGLEENPEDFSEDDALLKNYANAAYDRVEEVSAQILLDATFTFWLPRVPQATDNESYLYHGLIRLPNGPANAISSLQYFDGNNAIQTWDPSNYQLEPDTVDWQADLQAVTFNACFPRIFQTRKWPIKLTYTGGCGTTVASVPESARLAIGQLCAFWYRNREAFQAKQLPPDNDAWWQLIDNFDKNGRYGS